MKNPIVTLPQSVQEHQQAIQNYNQAVARVLAGQEEYCAMLEVFEQTLNQRTSVVTPRAAFSLLLKRLQKSVQ